MLSVRPENFGPEQGSAAGFSPYLHQASVSAQYLGAGLISEVIRGFCKAAGKLLVDIGRAHADRRNLRIGKHNGQRDCAISRLYIGQQGGITACNATFIRSLMEQG